MYQEIQPTQDQLDAEIAYTKSFNPYEWGLVQALIDMLMHDWAWLDFASVEPYLQALQLPDEPIDAEWYEIYDFRVSNGGFSVVAGEGGQWVSGVGWQATSVGSNVQVHIEKNFTNIATANGFLIFFHSGTNVSFTREISLKLRVNGTETTWHLASASASGLDQEVMLDGTDVPNADRLRVKNFQSGGSAPSVNISRLLMWGSGVSPF